MQLFLDAVEEEIDVETTPQFFILHPIHPITLNFSFDVLNIAKIKFDSLSLISWFLMRFQLCVFIFLDDILIEFHSFHH